jgi:RNA polymerase sigma-70 factor, ECF subfamily
MLFKKALALCPDEELMQKLKAGNEAALVELYQRYSVPMLRYFTRMLGSDKKKGEDFLHDLFIKIIDKPGRFDEGARFKTWIYSVANNMCKNEYRRQSYRQAVNGNGHDVADEHDAIRIDQEFLAQKLERILDTLAEDDRALFVLRYNEELGIQEISTILGLPEGTIKSRLFYLRRTLSKNIRDFKVLLEKD